MKTTEKLLSFFKRLESLSNDEWIELDLRMNEMVHDEKKTNKLTELIEQSKKELNDQERYAFEASLHRSATNVFVFNEKTQTEERVSLYLLPVSLLWNENKPPVKIESFFEQYFDVDKLLKKYKLISKNSHATLLPHWISFNQLEGASVKELSEFLKEFTDKEDFVSLKLQKKFEFNQGEMLYIPMIITESVFSDNVFIDNYDNLDYSVIAEMTEFISNELSSEDLLIIPDRFSEFHEALSTTKSSVFVDELMYHLEQARALNTPIKNIYLIKQNDSVVFSATDSKNEEIYHISIFSNSERVLTEIQENTQFNLMNENQVRLLETKGNVYHFIYIGNLS
jgi:hypothetical protein